MPLKAKRKTEKPPRDEQHKEAPNKPGHAKGQTKTTKEEEPQAPAKTKDNKAGKQEPTKGRTGRKASGDQQKRKEQTPGKAVEAGGRRQHKPRRRERAALTVSEGYSG